MTPNPISVAWGLLPPEARRSYRSLGNALAELSPGAAIRDTLDASGRIVGNALSGDAWGSLGAGANMLAAMAGIVPVGRAAKKAGSVATDLAMDETARLARAQEQGFVRPVYHGTSTPDFRAFSDQYSGRSTGNHTVGVGWSAENPEVANYFATLQEGNPRVLPLLARSSKPKTFKLRGDENHLDVQHAILDAFDAGHDAVRLLNYTAIPELGPQTIWAFREPNQLRSRSAKFDPKNALSSDLLAGVGGLTAAGVGLDMIDQESRSNALAPRAGGGY